MNKFKVSFDDVQYVRYPTILEKVYQYSGVRGKLEENNLILEYKGSEMKIPFIQSPINATIEEKINTMAQFLDILYERIRSLREIHQNKMDRFYSIINDRVNDLSDFLCDMNEEAQLDSKQ